MFFDFFDLPVSIRPSLVPQYVAAHLIGRMTVDSDKGIGKKK